MDAVCAKVDAANRVTLPSFPVPSSWVLTWLKSQRGRLSPVLKSAAPGL